MANSEGSELLPGIEVIKGLHSADLPLRYGENPHQQAAVYFVPGVYSPLQQLRMLAGRGLSHTNLTDINAGIRSVIVFPESPAAVVIKHNKPCGIALGDTPDVALKRALSGDPESAFGGVVVFNRPIGLETAEVVAKFKGDGNNIDVVAAPEVDEEALKLFRDTRKNMGVYRFGELPAEESGRHTRILDDGCFVVQTADIRLEDGFSQWEVATETKPSEEQWKLMEFGWKAISRIPSNAVLVVHREIPMTCGIGTGQTSRFRSTRLALEQARENGIRYFREEGCDENALRGVARWGGWAKSGILVSDSFFPFADSVRLAREFYIGAIIQQGGSVNDRASIDAANEAGIPMVLTHRRAFCH